MRSSNLRRRIGAALAAGVALSLATVTTPVSAQPDDGVVVVANRGSGDISVVDTADLSVTTYDLPGDAEPMYVNHDPDNDRVLVGDRASSTIVAFDDETYEVVGSVEVGEGVFHQWLDPARDQLWVTGTAGSTVSVVDTGSLSLITTFAIPADLIEAGGETHDVFVSGNNAFVSLVGLDGFGVVLRYSTKTFELTGQIETGGDPHLFVRGGRLHVASQDAGTVTTYVPATLRLVDSVEVPAAHGIFVTEGNELLVTNIAGGGDDALWSLDRELALNVDPIDTDAPVPHNVTVGGDGLAYITHSGGTSTALSVIDVDTGETTLLTVGTNPFGLAAVD